MTERRGRVDSDLLAHISPALMEHINVHEGRALVLDVRPAEEYAAGHVPGAVSIPLEELADRLVEIPSEAEVVAYCRGRYCVLSYDAVRLLRASGREVALLEDGILEWRRDGLPITTAA